MLQSGALERFSCKQNVAGEKSSRPRPQHYVTSSLNKRWTAIKFNTVKNLYCLLKRWNMTLNGRRLKFLLVFFPLKTGGVVNQDVTGLFTTLMHHPRPLPSIWLRMPAFHQLSLYSLASPSLFSHFFPPSPCSLCLSSSLSNSIINPSHPSCSLISSQPWVVGAHTENLWHLAWVTSSKKTYQVRAD